MVERAISHPTVTVGVPIYNGQKHLRQALDSLLRQDFQDFELILSDNGSTDDTPQICREYAARDPRIRYLRHPENLGHIKNFNQLPSMARGDFFMWAAADDLWHPQFISKLLQGIHARPEAVLAFCQGEFFEMKGVAHPRFYVDFPSLEGCSPVQRVRRILRYRATCSIVYGLHRRNALLRTGLFRDTDFPADLFLESELAAQGPFIIVPEVLFYKRGGGLSGTKEDVYYRKHKLFGGFSSLHCVGEWPLSPMGRVLVKWEMGRRIAGHHRSIWKNRLHRGLAKLRSLPFSRFAFKTE